MAEALFDWASGLTGLRVGPFTDLAGLYITEKNRLRAEEEQKRVFYVAMTRAREHLVISSGPSTNGSNGNFASLLDEPVDHKIASTSESTVVRAGRGKLLFEKLCVRCHGEQAHGNETIPRIAGQKLTYLQASLTRYRDQTGERNNPLMSIATAGLKNEDITALANYLTQLP